MSMCVGIHTNRALFKQLHLMQMKRPTAMLSGAWAQLRTRLEDQQSHARTHTHAYVHAHTRTHPNEMKSGRKMSNCHWPKKRETQSYSSISDDFILTSKYSTSKVKGSDQGYHIDQFSNIDQHVFHLFETSETENVYSVCVVKVTALSTLLHSAKQF